MSIVEGGVIGVPTDVRVFGDVGLSGGDGGEPVGDDEAGTGVADGEAPREVGAGADDDIGCVCHISNITYYRGNTSPHPISLQLDRIRNTWTTDENHSHPFYHAVLGIKNPASKGGENQAAAVWVFLILN